MNPLQKLGRKINKALGGGAASRKQSMGISETNGSQYEDDHRDSISTNDMAKSPELRPIQENKGFVHNVSSGMEHFIRAITDNPKPLPVPTSLPDEEDNDAEQDTGKVRGSQQEEAVELDENTPIEVLLARIEFLEASLRSEKQRSDILEEQVTGLEERCRIMEQVSHQSILSRIIRPFRICFGGGRNTTPPPPERHNAFSGY